MKISEYVAEATDREPVICNILTLHVEDAVEEVGRFTFKDDVLTFEGDAEATIEMIIHHPTGFLLRLSTLLDDHLCGRVP